MRELKKEEIEQLKDWADKKIKEGSKSKDVKEIIREKYGEKTADLVLESELESDVGWLKGYVEKKKKEEETQTYTHLIGYALLSLFIAVSFWYSASKMIEATQELELVGISILGNITSILWIGVALSILFFIGFTIAFIFKKYKIYKDYIKKDLKKKDVP